MSQQPCSLLLHLLASEQFFRNLPIKISEIGFGMRIAQHPGA